MRRLLLVVVLLGAAACGGGQPGGDPAVTAAASMTVTSTAFREDGTIPRQYTCDGAGTSPPLAWSGTPTAAKALAIVVDDPDAPSGTFTHWVLLDLDPKTTSLSEGTTPQDAKQALNSAGKPSYYGPCPPSGTHHYRFTVYALSAPTGLAAGARLDAALKAIGSKNIGHGRLTGLYAR